MPGNSLRDIILYAIKRCRGIQKSLRAKMRFEFRYERLTFRLADALNHHAAVTIRRRGRHGAEFRT